MRQRAVLPLVAVLLLQACGAGGDSTGAKGGNGLNVLASPPVTDTVFARPSQALVIEVRPGRTGSAGAIVKFENVDDSSIVRGRSPFVYFKKASQSFFSESVIDTADAAGRASVQLVFGGAAGTARVLVSAPELGLSHTIPLTLKPGVAKRVVVTSADTVVQVGGAATVAGYATDAYGNRVPDPVTFSAGSNIASVDATGRATAGQSTGRAAVVIRSGDAIDTARFTVMPLGTMVFVKAPDQGASWIATANLDGSGIKLVTGELPFAYPSASPTSDLIVFQQYDAKTGPALFVVDGSGVRRPLLAPGPIAFAGYPRFGADGKSVVFTAGTDPIHGDIAVWTVNADGSGLQRVDASEVTYWVDTQPSITSDGTRVVFPQDNTVVTQNVATGQRSVHAGRGSFPVLSPDGQRLAYILDFTIVVRGPGSSDVLSIRPSVNVGDTGLSWLPDSRWLITRGYNGPLLVNAITGEVISLPGMREFHEIQVRP
jgi:Tol biopolymer transport system component